MTDPHPARECAAISAGAHSAARVGAVLALSVGAVALVGAGSLALGIPLSPIALVVTILGAACWLWPRLDSPPQATRATGVAAFIMIAAMLGASRVFDLSFDGQTYHQSAVRLLANGWNPVWFAQHVTALPNGLYIETLPKGAWIVEAMIVQATGSLESAKGLGFVMLAGAFLLAWPALECLGVRSRAAMTIAGLAAASPIAMVELMSFYVDGLVVSALVMSIALIILWMSSEGEGLEPALVLIAAFLVNLKFTGGVYAAVLAVAAAMIIAATTPHRLRRAIALGGFAASIALLEGLNPYVTNTMHHGHPAYPGAGAGAVPVVALVWRDRAFAARSAPVQLITSIFAQSTDDDAAAPVLKIPFTIHARELAAFFTVDTRLAGWGPWYSAGFVLALGMLVLAVVRGDKRAPFLLGASVVLTVSALAVPAAGYARYAPQLWLACIPALLLDDLRSWASRALAAVLIVNIVIVSVTSLGAQLFVERLHRGQLVELARDAGTDTVSVSQFDAPFVNVDLHLDAYGIRWKTRSTPECARPATLLKTHARICIEAARSPAPAPDPAAVAGQLFAALRTERFRR